ncbi:magnesium transporter NIPA-domain-containing protein [Lophiotrema nucula]|uniref:Magnesium transporter NIPA-domain-containing protein n=1 Tax=Lophiotrema nucula TaxID=690887 RepID=A0A6A5Z6A7_9PLEO|nr:magnesium transporter NIPA-domain-containing protein [Lophiotrema nucula]
MILPRHVAAGPATSTLYNPPSATSSPSSGSPHVPENWSSLIGIVTAIIGNVLISFALNIQRYAHIKLDREWQEKERQRKRRSTTNLANQAKVSEERTKANLARRYHPPRHAAYTVENERDALHEGAVATETDPLIPSVKPSRTYSRPTLQSLESTDSGNSGFEEEAYKQQSYLKSPWWWLGIVLMTTGEAGNFLAYGFAPASIVSPLGVVALISNCIIAPIMLKEQFRKRDGLGVLVAVAGAVTVVLSASDNNPKLGPGEIWQLITRWEFETYLGITVAVIIALMVASNRYGDKSILIDLGLVGLFGGYTALSTKGVASLLSYTLWRAITFPVTYLLVAILVITAVMQIKYVNRALQRFDATQVIPTQFVLFTLSVILGSAILYQDFKRKSGDDAGKFVGGCALTFLGVWMITSGRPPREEEDEDRDPEPEDAINLMAGERYHDVIDGASDGEAGSSTRRPSTIRAKSPPLNINTRVSTRDASLPSTPSITFTPDTNGPPHPETPHGTTPQPPSPMTDNRWGSSSPAVRPPSGPISKHSTLSTPFLPSEAMAQPPASTSSPELSGPPLPHTPVRGNSDHLLQITPGTSNTLNPRVRRMGTAERLGARNSIAGPLLASPFSTSLSAVVADLKRSGSLRSNAASREGDSVRRRESVMGIGASEVDGYDDADGAPLGRRRTATEEVPSSQASRQRGLSGTFRDLWREFRGGDGNQPSDTERGQSRG